MLLSLERSQTQPGEEGAAGAPEPRSPASCRGCKGNGSNVPPPTPKRCSKVLPGTLPRSNTIPAAEDWGKTGQKRAQGTLRASACPSRGWSTLHQTRAGHLEPTRLVALNTPSKSNPSWGPFAHASAGPAPKFHPERKQFCPAAPRTLTADARRSQRPPLQAPFAAAAFLRAHFSKQTPRGLGDLPLLSRSPPDAPCSTQGFLSILLPPSLHRRAGSCTGEEEGPACKGWPPLVGAMGLARSIQALGDGEREKIRRR